MTKPKPKPNPKPKPKPPDDDSPQGYSCPCGFHGDGFCRRIGCPRRSA